MGPVKFEDSLTLARLEFPDLKIVPKSGSRLMKAIDVFLKILTFGAMSRFMTGFNTTMGHTVYVGESWNDKDDVDKIVTLRHEMVHMRQAARLGRLWFSFLYLFIPFPVGLARYRAKFEMEAYEETIRAVGELRGAAAVAKIDRARMVSHFTSAEYAWAWPFRRSVEAWFDQAVVNVLRELATSKEKQTS